MTSYKLVMPGDMNHYGFLFGGKMLMWVDEVGWMAVSADYPGCSFVTVGMGEVSFHKSVHPQSVLRFETAKKHVGRTSVTYRVEVFRRHVESREETSVFTTDITFVRVDRDGGKLPIPLDIPAREETAT
jgi:acyl-CoA hydrolase